MMGYFNPLRLASIEQPCGRGNGMALATSFFLDKLRLALLVRVDVLAKWIGRHGLSRGSFCFFRCVRSSR